VQEGIYDEFLQKFRQEAENINIGDPFDETIFQG